MTTHSYKQVVKTIPKWLVYDCFNYIKGISYQCSTCG